MMRPTRIFFPFAGHDQNQLPQHMLPERNSRASETWLCESIIFIVPNGRTADARGNRQECPLSRGFHLVSKIDEIIIRVSIAFGKSSLIVLSLKIGNLT